MPLSASAQLLTPKSMENDSPLAAASTGCYQTRRNAISLCTAMLPPDPRATPCPVLTQQTASSATIPVDLTSSYARATASPVLTQHMLLQACRRDALSTRASPLSVERTMGEEAEAILMEGERGGGDRSAVSRHTPSAGGSQSCPLALAGREGGRGRGRRCGGRERRGGSH
eukprot:2341769-Rhodomonas_salina.1